jgi:HTH-type transcriptional regulator, fmd operon transcriptional regulator
MFLTDRQVEILRLKKKGLRSTDISRIMKTTRANICTVEKTALKNIEKAENTIKFYRAFEAPVWLSFPAGTDLYDIPDILAANAKKHKVKPAMESVDVMVKLKTEAFERIRGRILTEDINISIDKQGCITIH